MLTPTRPTHNVQRGKSPWWQCLSPLDPQITRLRSPLPLSTRLDDCSRSPLYQRTRLSPASSDKTHSRMWTSDTPSGLENCVVQATFGDRFLPSPMPHTRDPARGAATKKASTSGPNGDYTRPRFMQKLDFTHTAQKDSRMLMFNPTESESSYSISISSQGLSPRCRIRSRSSSPAFQSTSSSPPFDPSAPIPSHIQTPVPTDSSTTGPIEIVTEAAPDVPEVPVPSPAPNSGGDPVGESASTSGKPRSRVSGGRSLAPTPAHPTQENFKPCNCKKSKCLKLYCECFARQTYCTKECNCTGCCNVPEKKEVRQKAVLAILERDINAFYRASSKGNAKKRRTCRCKKSQCLKKYCECFQAGLKCTDACKCLDCLNGGHKDRTKHTKALKANATKQVRTSASSTAAFKAKKRRRISTT